MQVKDCITTQVITVAPETSAKEAFATMKSMGIRHLVVVKGEQIVGIVTDRDLRRPKVSDIFKSWHDLYRISDEFQVEDVMSSPVMTIDAHADVKEAAKVMVERRIGALPVTDAHHGLFGIITEIDLLKALIAAI
jgi:acetoin utilization protein AcuB